MVGLRASKGIEMADELSPTPTRELAARIVAAYLRRNQVRAEEMSALITSVHQALSELGGPKPAEVAEPAPAVPIRRSVSAEFVVCLDCGWKGKTLRRHVGTTHGLSLREYRTRWKLPTEHPVVAPSYSERRSGMAKQLGLGRGRFAPPGTAAAAAFPSRRPEAP